MKTITEMSEKEFNEAIEKIESERKEYLQSEEYRQSLRDKGEKIMRLLIKDNANTPMNLGCALSIHEDTTNPDYERKCDEETFNNLKESYQMGEGALSAVKQANNLMQQIMKIYYGKI